MDYQQRQFEARPGQEVFVDGNKLEMVANRDARAVGERVVDLNDKIVEPVTAEINDANRVEMLTPVDMGLVKTDIVAKDDNVIDFSAISNNRGDRLGEKAVEQVVACEKEFGKDGDTEKFYDKVIEMKKALLKNNYGREIGEKVA